MTSLLSLPHELVGLLYNLLPDAASKSAFAACSSAIRSAPSVQAQISRLTISYTQLGDPACKPLAHRTLRHVKLRTLVIVGRDTQKAVGSHFRDEGLALLRLLQPQDVNIRSRVWEATQSLQELEMQGGIGFSESSAAWLGSYLGTLPSLSTIRIVIRLTEATAQLRLRSVLLSQVPASFFAGLSAPSPALQLRVLEITAQHLSHAHILALSQLTGLQSLSCLPGDHVQLGPLGSLQQLTTLSLQAWWPEVVREDMAWLAELYHLRSLKLTLIGARVSLSPVMEMLPISLQTLIFGSEFNPADLRVLAQFIRPDRLPNMRCIEVDEMELSIYIDDDLGLDWDESGADISEWLDSYPQLSINIGWLETANDMEGFLMLCTHVPALARGIKGVSLGNDRLDSALSLLADVGASLEWLNLRDCSLQDLAIVHEGMKRLTSLSDLNILYMRETFPPPGFSATIVSLCAQAASVLSAPCEVFVDWCPTGPYGSIIDLSKSDDVTRMRVSDRKQEMAALKGAWERTSRALPATSQVKLLTRFQRQEF